MAFLAVMLTALPHKGEAEPLSQEGAVKKAIARHPVIRAAGHEAEAAEARVRQAKTGWLPRVRIEGGYQYVGPQQRMKMTVQPDFLPDPIEINNDIGSVHNASVGAQVAWRVYDFGARDVAAKAARAAVAAARAEGKEREAEIAYAVRAAYLAALFFGEVERVTKASLVVTEKEKAEEKVKKEAGVGSDLDLARVETRVAQLQARLTEARQEWRRALTTLGLLLGLSDVGALRLTDSLQGLASLRASGGAAGKGTTPGSGPAPGNGPEEGKDGGGGADARADGGDSARHPRRLRLEALRQAAELNLSGQWRRMWPTLDLVGSVKYQYPKNYFENDRAGFFYAAGLMLTWNVFDGDLLRRQRAETRARIAQLESLSLASDEEVARQVADAQARRRSAQAASESAVRVLAAAGVYLKAAQVSHKAGTGTALEVKRAEEAAEQAELSLRKAWFDAALAAATELRARGVGSLSRGAREARP